MDISKLLSTPAILLALVSYLIGAVWWGSGVSTKLDNIFHELDALFTVSAHVTTTEKDVAILAVQVSSLQAQLDRLK